MNSLDKTTVHKTTVPKWGLVSTIKAPTQDIIDFCAHHLDLGAHRLYIYLDDDNHEAFEQLQNHPKIRPTLCDAAYWSKTAKQRPQKHQSRQTANAMNAYRKRAEVDWMTHIDVDEFLWPNGNQTLGEQLATLPNNSQTARVYPIEFLVPPQDLKQQTVAHFKSCHRKRNDRTKESAFLYPNFGAYLDGGFLSHVQGKVFYRTAIQGLKIRIHNAFLDGESNPNCSILDNLELCHFHAKSWENWYAALRYRHSEGSYRAELKPVFDKNRGGLTMHQFFQSIESQSGEQGLIAFFKEVCTATPELLENLRGLGHLRTIDLDLTRKNAVHFPDWTRSHCQ